MYIRIGMSMVLAVLTAVGCRYVGRYAFVLAWPIVVFLLSMFRLTHITSPRLDSALFTAFFFGYYYLLLHPLREPDRKSRKMKLIVLGVVLAIIAAFAGYGLK